MNLIFGSVTSGIEAASVAWGPLGWKAAFVAEIEPFPCHLLHHHYGAGRPHHMPDPTDAGLTLEERDARLLAIKNVSALPIKHKGLRNLGDLNKYKEWSDDFYLDVLCGGTPCQSYSNAGLRAGLDDPRGQLMLAFGGVAAKYRPRWLVWENVPGVLSSNGGRDFAELLGLLTGQQVSVPAGGWKNSGVLAGIAAAYGVAWRVLDAQYAGLAQRRERVFLVGYLGDWRPAAAVFFERHSMQGHRAPSRRPAQAPSGRTDGGVAVRGAPGGPEVSATIDANYGRLQGTSGQDAGHGHATLAIVKKEEAGPAAFGGNNTTGPIDVATAVRAHSSFHGDFESETFIAFDTTQITNKDNRSNPQPGDPCHTLPAHGHPPAIAFQTRGVDRVDMQTDLAYALLASGNNGGRRHEMNVAVPIGFNARQHPESPDGGAISGTLDGGSPQSQAVAFKASHFTRGKDGSPRDTSPALSADADKGDQDPLLLTNLGGQIASTQEANTRALLFALRECLGAEAYAVWRLGILDSFQSPEVLRQDLHGASVRGEADEGWRGLGGGSLSGEEDGAARAMREVREAGRNRRTPQGRGFQEQLARELDAALSKLSHEGTQTGWVLSYLRGESEGAGLLQSPLHPVQRGAMAVRRFTPLECEKLQGFPVGYTLVPYRTRRAQDFDEWYAYLKQSQPDLAEKDAMLLAADGPRYKSIGNSWAVPVVTWIGTRIEAVEAVLKFNRALGGLTSLEM